MKVKIRSDDGGFTLVEMVVGLTVLMIVVASFLGLFTALVRSNLVAKRKAVASSLATNQIEYLKSLPYDNLAVAGGSIYATSPLPAQTTKKIDGFTYKINTSINYVDDAFDGCYSYPTQALKEKYCRNYPPPSGAPTTDTNPADYKIAHVSIANSSNAVLADVDTQISARVSETSSTTGAMIINVIDGNGNPVQGATVSIVNSTVSPNVNVSDSTDSAGIAIFYGLPPDSNNYDFVATSSKSGYSTLSSIAPSGVLQPNYSNLKVFTQQTSYLTMVIKPQGSDSLLVEATDTSGSPINNLKIYTKGGYKKYTASSDTTYYFDNFSPSDTRPTTNSSGNATLSNLVPGPYFFCGDDGSSNCKVGNTTYYLVGAVPYTGSSIYSPTNVPIYDSASPPSQTFNFGGINYYQKVRLIFSTNASYPRITTMTPSEESISGGSINNFAFTITGKNLPCNASPASCSTTVTIKQGATNYVASCTGAAAGILLNCTANLTGISAGSTELVISSGGYTYTSPGSPLLGGINVIP